jgi:hypothetical protein
MIINTVVLEMGGGSWGAIDSKFKKNWSIFVTKIRMQKILKRHNSGTYLKGIEISFQMVPLFVKSFQFWVSYITF